MMSSNPGFFQTGKVNLSLSPRASSSLPIFYCTGAKDIAQETWVSNSQISSRLTVWPTTIRSITADTLTSPFQTSRWNLDNTTNPPPSDLCRSMTEDIRPTTSEPTTSITAPKQHERSITEALIRISVPEIGPSKPSNANLIGPMKATSGAMTTKPSQDKNTSATFSSHERTPQTTSEAAQSHKRGHSSKHRPAELEPSPRPLKKPKGSQISSEASTPNSLENLPTFKKVKGVLQNLLQSFNEDHSSDISVLLRTARRAGTKSSASAPTPNSTLSKDKEWTYQTGLKRAEKLFAVRRLPYPSSRLSSVWEALFTNLASAKAFYAKVGHLSDHSVDNLQRQARAKVEANGGEVSFRCSYWQETAGPTFPSLSGKDMPKPSSNSKLGKSTQLSHYVWPGGTATSKTQIHTMATEINTFSSDVTACPPFKWYRPVQSNTLAQNDKRLLVWPIMNAYATEEQQEMMESELKERFARVNPETRRHHANPLLNLASRQLNETVIEPFLRLTLRNHCGPEKISEKDLILQYFLSTSPSLPDTIPAEIRTAWLARERQINYASENWVLVASSLPEPSNLQLAAATIICSAFELETRMSLWHWIRPYAEEVLRKLVDGNTEGQIEAEFDMLCRVCYVRNCFQHGIISEDQEEEDEEQPFLINLKQHISGRALSPQASLTGYPKRKDIQFRFPKTQPFMPCSHLGTCEDAKCICFRLQRTCEKACHCSYSCDRRFPGCSCAKTNRTCATDSCVCVASERECDADLCGKCGAAELLLSREADPPQCCANVAIQRSIPKRLLTGKSSIRGFGLYMGELTKKHEYIAEYKGEIVSRYESDRRGVEYHYQAAQYLWGIDKEQDYDATAVGSKMRFPNHSGDAATINMHCKTKFCNGSWRVGFWASRTIQPGEELFFNYGYPEDHTRDFWEPGLEKGSSNVAARKAKNRPLKTTKSKGSRSVSVTDKAKAKGLRGLTTGPHVGWDDLRGASGSQTVVDSEASSAASEIGTAKGGKRKLQRGKARGPRTNVAANTDVATDNEPVSETQRRVSNRKTRPSAARLAMAESLAHPGEETGAEGDDDMGESDFESEHETTARKGKKRKVARPSRYTR